MITHDTYVYTGIVVMGPLEKKREKNLSHILTISVTSLGLNSGGGSWIYFAIVANYLSMVYCFWTLKEHNFQCFISRSCDRWASHKLRYLVVSFQ